MWPALVYGLQSLMSASADDGANVVKEEPRVGVPEDANIPGLDGKMPSAEQLLEMLDSMSSISEEDKASLKEDLLKNIQERAAQAQAAMPANDLTTQTIILLSLLTLVALIFGNLLEAIKSSGVLSEGAQEKVLSMIQRYQQLNEDEKEEFKVHAQEIFKDSVNKIASEAKMRAWFMALTPNRYVVFVFAVLIVAAFLVFFVYKLFRCLSEREAKREEKKKNKQLKKKK